MQAPDLFEETFFSLSANKSRSILTILGIVIGIASVITMISVGQGAAQDITGRIESLGTNLLVISPGSGQQAGTIVRGGAGSAETLKISDAEAIRASVPEAELVAPVVNSRKQVIAKGQNTNTSIYGIETNYFTIKAIVVENGSAFTDRQNTSRAKVAVLGPTANTDLFGEGFNSVGQKIKINNQEFTVIGITQAKGGTGFGNADDLIYIPLNTALQYISGSDSLSSINVQVSEAELMTVAQAEIQDLLLQRHRINDPANADFSIVSQADLLSSLSSVSDTLTMLLGAIGGISLIVGGIGIMNMMLTTVTERTREIGLRKSLGATKNDISWQFLAESVALTFIGGIIGIMIGYLASLAVTKFSGINTNITMSSVLIAVGVSGLIGILFGYYPARRAAKMDPIEALRYQ
ncbi:MAG: ABC transporter, permease protein [Candidatus Magasanikbacteria bacterium GW2011_GWC2_37_14]|uniref:ABC transporter, permease protein n=1 Tax=Candidatus Magasanikbacteria bacterium GW2011_GWC2_37_14 TaxID=1619046 RepID=A0A0G0GD09_9BACT|nr:MAG: ABC transporter, permease protein [Candidatus Magasanikbacteria bacterium GW2011_GWC2_37_14]